MSENTHAVEFKKTNCLKITSAQLSRSRSFHAVAAGKQRSFHNLNKFIDTGLAQSSIMI